MNDEILKSEERLKYGKFSGYPAPEQLAKYFLLEAQDKLLIFKRKGSHNHLGFALQVGYSQVFRNISYRAH